MGGLFGSRNLGEESGKLEVLRGDMIKVLYLNV
jgi:hypothetical protein